MPISFTALEIGLPYDRTFLAQLWGYQDFHAISRGVITPAQTNYIILFVTEQKQQALPQYKDHIEGNMLFWEGEEGHGSDQRIVDANKQSDEIHLFYRKVHHSPFLYYGHIALTSFEIRARLPSKFVFRIQTS